MMLCSVPGCYAPTVGFFNVNASAASTVTAYMVPRCRTHLPYRVDIRDRPQPEGAKEGDDATE